MVKFSKEILERLLLDSNKIRNISIIAHVDHGKSTLTDQLALAAGLVDEDAAGEKRVCDVDKNEIEKGITIKSTSLSMVLENPDKENDHHLVNLIDCPGHIDFSSEVSTALRITDGAVLIVDAAEGCRGQTETVIRQSLQERIRPVLFINKVDRLIEEMQFTEEESYQNFLRIIESVNALLSTYSDESVSVDPVDCNIAFGSGKMGWAFTLEQFAQLYSKKFKLPVEKVINKLWGENYYDHSTKKFTTEPYSSTSGEQLKHTFCEFILEPIFKIFKLVREHEISSEGILSTDLENIISALSIPLTKEEKRKEPKLLAKSIMRKFLPAHKPLVQMIINHLPSPKEAQKVRYDNLYTGEDLTDPYATGIKECDPNAPLVVYVSKMVPMHSNTSSSMSNNVGRFIALARIFSGSLTQSTKVRILGPNYDPIAKKDVFHTSIQRLLVMVGKNTESITQASCGAIVGIVGLDKYIIKSCTLTEEGQVACMPIKNMKYSVSPVVQMGVEPANPADLSRFVEGLKRLVQSDPLLECKQNDSGQHILGTAGELHLEICLKNLEEEYARGIQIKKSPPVVTFHETVSNKNGDMVMARSANGHNRLYMQAEPISEELIEMIKEGQLPMDDQNKRAKILEIDFEWDPSITKRIWSFGPEADKGSNILVNATKSVDYINEIQQYVVTSFQQSSSSGGLCDEAMRGVLFKFNDCNLHADSIHRGAGQILQATSRVMTASQLRADPKLVEPMYLVEVQCPQSVMGSVYSVISNRRGVIKSTEMVIGTPLVSITGSLPVLESFGLTEELRGVTQGQAFPQCSFSHWKVMEDNVYDPQSKVHKLIKSIRKRKGLKEDIPLYTDYCDTMPKQ
ncbi:translation elongation factor 2 [Naegleria gruberi]|uniref:Elongation factor 2 n=1 Tax=Naegleria gruberi TaxID=5762 RepID=D2VH01_NAEGR|nr:translation elongation factor 2 [Naegleria gruberi]EFC43897.1 translation elongation factor 2 [Naegleria gruberi]|eukprot:XP_002676641.1 translation elongation factor 2 [Naegleria gruberi strain NEG-M]